MVFVLAAVLAVLSTAVGTVNREVLDGPTFVANADALRTDPDVAAAVGARVADSVVAARPDLVAVKPLVASVGSAVASSAAAGPLFRLAAAQVHEAMTTSESDQLVLRLADVGAVVSAALRSTSPEAAAAIPPELPVTLTSLGGQGGVMGTVIGWADLVGVLAWLVPMLTLAALVGGVALHPEPRRGFLRAGLAVVAGGAAVLLLAVVGEVWAAAADAATLGGAVRHALWAQLGRPLYTRAGLLLVLGALVVVLAAPTRTAGTPVGPALASLGARLRRRPVRRWAAVGRALAVGSAGLGVVLWPESVLRALTVVAGLGALLWGLLELDRVLGRVEAPARQEPPRSVAGGDGPPAPAGARRRAGVVRIGLLSATALVVLGVLGAAARPAAPVPPVAAGGCNGHTELCDRPYDEVAYPAAHNAMSAEDAGFYLAEQPTGMVGLLEQGVGVLLVDTWYGQPVASGGAVTAERSLAGVRSLAQETFGPDVMPSVERLVARVQRSGGDPTGPVAPYLCHTFCEIGATPLLPELEGVRAWMQAHPSEVVTIFVQDGVTPADTAEVFDEAGLTPMTYTPGGVHAPWPTLGEMVDSGRRLVVLMENHAGGRAHPWLLPGFDYVQDTGYAYPTAADFDCRRNRGGAQAPLLLVNHWLSGFSSLRSDAAEVNAADVLGPRLRECERRRDRVPNYVAVDWVDVGDLYEVVDEVNGLTR